MHPAKRIKVRRFKGIRAIAPHPDDASNAPIHHHKTQRLLAQAAASDAADRLDLANAELRAHHADLEVSMWEIRDNPLLTRGPREQPPKPCRKRAGSHGARPQLEKKDVGEEVYSQ